MNKYLLSALSFIAFTEVASAAAYIDYTALVIGKKPNRASFTLEVKMRGVNLLTNPVVFSGETYEFGFPAGTIDQIRFFDSHYKFDSVICEDLKGKNVKDGERLGLVLTLTNQNGEKKLSCEIAGG